MIPLLIAISKYGLVQVNDGKCFPHACCLQYIPGGYIFGIVLTPMDSGRE